MNAPVTLQRTALFGAHEKLGARLVEFGGWQMPVLYTGIVDEHKAVREAAGVFDISHMGEFFFSGAGAPAFVNGLLTNDAARLAVGQGQYTLMLNEEGGVIDDLILYRLHETEFFLVVNAAKIAEDVAWLKHIVPAGVTFYDKSDSYSALALQGPKALEIAHRFFGADWVEPKRNEITEVSWNSQPILTARTGYTGEDGLELFFPNEIAERFFENLLECGRPLGLKPCGLGARDTLRLEACLPLNGNDLSAQRTPLSAGLGAFVSLAKAAEFPGKEVLLREKVAGPREALVAFRLMDKGPPPRPHYALFSGAERVGEVTSGAPSPTLGAGIGLAYVAPAMATPGTVLELEVRGARVPVEIVKKPFYRRAASAHNSRHFMSNVPDQLRYATSHEWIKVEGDIGTVGVSDHAQHELSDVVYVDLPKVGAQATAGSTIAVIESVKAASDIYAPVTGEVVEINAALTANPELVNSDPYGAAWLFKVRLSNAGEVAALKDAAAYRAQVES